MDEMIKDDKTEGTKKGKKNGKLAAGELVPARVSVAPRKPGEWMKLLDDAEKTHWRRLRVVIQIREWLMAGKPAKLDAANAMIKARGLEDVLEARMDLITDPKDREAKAEEVKDEGLCEFWRRDGKPGIWMPSNHVKAGVKENWSVLGYRVEHRGSRGGIAEGTFVVGVKHPIYDKMGWEWTPAERDWIYLGAAPSGVHTAVSHTTGPSGPVSSIKRHEYIVKPRLEFTINIACAVAQKLPDESMADMLVHFAEHGIGACRSQGFGRFDVVSVEEASNEL